MSSQLAAIYDAMAELEISVTLAGDTVEVVAIPRDDLAEVVDSHRMPCRMLIPAGAESAGALNQAHTFGRGTAPTLTVDWAFQDLLFLSGADSGQGLLEVGPILIDYMADYIRQVAGLRRHAWSVTRVEFPVVGGFEWPAQSGRQYHGILARVTVREIC